MAPDAIVKRLNDKEERKGADEFASHDRLIKSVGVEGIGSIVKRIDH